MTHSSISYQDNDVVPDDFICPLTLNIMKDPVMTRSGLTFERTAILEWLSRGNSTCPLSRRRLRLSDLTPNHSLRKKIQQWETIEHQQKYNTTRKTIDDESSDEMKVRCFGILEFELSEEQKTDQFIRAKIASVMADSQRYNEIQREVRELEKLVWYGEVESKKESRQKPITIKKLWNRML